MKRVLFALCALLGCSASKEETRAAPPKSTALSGSAEQDTATSARMSVGGGEVLKLRGAEVRIVRVTFEDHPCAEGQQCLTSGVMKRVEFAVTKGAQQQSAAVEAGEEKVVLEVMLRVHSVVAGPRADVEASLPLSAHPAASGPPAAMTH